jgi:hypothetical protein
MVIAFSFPSRPACAAEGVLLFELPSLRPELCAALRIQLTDLARVDCRAEDDGAPLTDRLGAAARTVQREDAQLAVLLERDPDPRLVRMVLVGRRADQAVLTIERIEDRPEPDVDRSLALKVRDALDVLVATREIVAQRSPLPALLTPPRDSAPSADTGAGPKLLFEAGGALSVGHQLRGAGLIGLGGRFAVGLAALELLALGQLASRVHERGGEGQVDEREWGISASARALRTFAHGSVGALAELGFVRYDARGETLDRSSGSSKGTLLRTALGLDLRVHLVRGMSLRFAPALELFPIAQQFALDERVNMTLGRLRALLPLTLLIDFPVGRERASDAN